MTGTLRAGILIALLVVGTGLAPGLAAADDPTFSATTSDPVLEPGATQTVTVFIENAAPDPDDSVETAREVRVTATGAGSDIEVHSGPQYVGQLRDGDRVPVTLRVSVPGDVPSGSYALSLSVRYVQDDERHTTTITAPVRIDDRPRFAVLNSTSTLSADGSGTLSLTIRNEGTEPATDATVAVRSRSGAILVDGGTAGTRSVGTIDPGATATLEVPLSSTESATEAPYALLVEPTYASSGERVTATPLAVTVKPAAVPRISIEDADVSMVSERSGTLTATVTNRGSEPVEAVRVEFRSPAKPLTVREPTVSVGPLEPGATRTVTTTVQLAPDATAANRPFTAVASYTDGSGIRSSAHPTRFAVTVEPEPAIAVEPVEATVAPDTTDTVRLKVTNRAGEPLEDLRARISPSPPVTSTSPQAYVGTLEPGESTSISLGVTIDEDAVAMTDGLAVTVTGETAPGRTLRSGPSWIALTVSSTESPVSNPAVVSGAVLAAVLVIVGGWWWYNRADK
jgi:hypothetical protein